MKKIDLLAECQKELEQEKITMTKEEIKMRLREIEYAQKTLKKLQAKLDLLLEGEIE